MPINKVMVLGATGMLGHTIVNILDQYEDIEISATVRKHEKFESRIKPETRDKIIFNIDAEKFDSLAQTIKKTKPDIIVNCIGVIKQLSSANDPITSIYLNSLFPHKLAALCQSNGARLIHISTDCVFSGKKGLYTEEDFPDCDDLYGRTKLLGEVDTPHAVTLRTSVIGHELQSNLSLVEWFLSQKEKVHGYTKAIYSGFPSVELARIIAEIVIPRQSLKGLYHLSSSPISKYELLCLIAREYNKEIEIEQNDNLCCDRSLDSSRFNTITGYVPPTWPKLVKSMHTEWQCQRKNIS